jgi:signal transduction histidine kinase
VAGQVDVLQELDRLRVEIDGLRAARKRLVLARDADRRAIERDLHDGVHQYLIALAVNLQLAGQAVESDRAAAKLLLDEMGRDVQKALDETAQLSQRIYPTTVEAGGGLGALLRSAAVNAGVPASVDAVDFAYPPEVGMTVYLCWLETLVRERGHTRVRIRVWEDQNALAFEIATSVLGSETDLGSMQDRVEALGGSVTIDSGTDRGVRISGSLPLAR